MLQADRWLGLGGERDGPSESGGGGWAGKGVEGQERKGKGYRTLLGGEEKPGPQQTSENHKEGSN